MLITRPLSARTKTTAICSANDLVGDLVYVTAGLSGSEYQVAKADISTPEKMPVIAVIIAKLSNTRCVIQLQGEIKGVYTGLIPGKTYFVGADGRPSALPPSPLGSGSKAYIQAAGVAVDDTILLFNPVNELKIRVG